MAIKDFSFKKDIVSQLISGRITKKEAEKILKVKRQTLNRYIRKVTHGGLEALQDKGVAIVVNWPHGK